MPIQRVPRYLLLLEVLPERWPTHGTPPRCTLSSLVSCCDRISSRTPGPIIRITSRCALRSSSCGRSPFTSIALLTTTKPTRCSNSSCVLAMNAAYVSLVVAAVATRVSCLLTGCHTYVRTYTIRISLLHGARSLPSCGCARSLREVWCARSPASVA